VIPEEPSLEDRLAQLGVPGLVPVNDVEASKVCGHGYGHLTLDQEKVVFFKLLADIGIVTFDNASFTYKPIFSPHWTYVYEGTGQGIYFEPAPNPVHEVMPQLGMPWTYCPVLLPSRGYQITLYNPSGYRMWQLYQRPKI